MPTIKDFIENNDNVKIKIALTPDMDSLHICNETLYEGMLYDIPEELQKMNVVDEGYMINAQCNCLTVMKNKYKIEITENLSRIVEVAAIDEKEAVNLVEEMYSREQIVLDAQDMKEYQIEPYKDKKTYMRHNTHEIELTR